MGASSGRFWRATAVSAVLQIYRSTQDNTADTAVPRFMNDPR
ncbi:MAG: hypothetical protein ACYSWU_12535 [Planctomycetota bacterium]|jgi:hypothetical protein